MKKILYSNITILSLSTLLNAGGDILPIVPVVPEVEKVVVPVEPKIVLPPKKAAIVPVEELNPLGLYVGLGLTLAKYDPKCGCFGAKGSDDTTAGLLGRVGYDVNQYFGIEGRAIRTNWQSHGGKIKHAGLFAKPMYPVSKDMNLYALLGYAKTTTQGSKRRVDAETFAWGAGLEYDLSKDSPKSGKYKRDFDGYGDQEKGWGLFVDYERLVQKSGSPDLDAIGFGVTYDF